MITDLKIIKPTIGTDVYRWEGRDDVLPILKSLKFYKGYKAVLKVDHNEGVYATKTELVEAWKAFTET